MKNRTPGPWKVTAVGPHEHLRVDGPEDQMIAALFREEEGNAQLIATAPAMLAALEQIANLTVEGGTINLIARSVIEEAKR